jgi:hypothetical protein
MAEARMAKARLRFALPQVAAFTVWLAVVFAAAHYALRMEFTLGVGLINAVGCIAYSSVVLGLMWIYQRETLRGSLVISRLLVERGRFHLQKSAR